MFPVFYHPNYSINWSTAHRFPMSKFQRLHQMLLGKQLIAAEQFCRPEPVSLETAGLIHREPYLQQFVSGTLDAKAVRRIGLGWTPQLVTRTRTEVGGTICTVRAALEHGLALNCAGGTHHAFPDYGSGFCVLNDLAIAAKLACSRGWLKKILIFDTDVHQGDGTAFAFQEDDRVFTCSIHCGKNFPFRKQQSDLDIALPPGTGDGDYLAVVEHHLSALIDQVKPDLVLYDAGVDVFAGDRLGHFQLSYEGIYQRDRFVVETCRSKSLPLACVIGGGYADQLDELTNRHLLLFQAAVDVVGE